MNATIAWLQRCLYSSGCCPDGGKCHHECNPQGYFTRAIVCWRRDKAGCVALSGAGLDDKYWKPAVTDAMVERACRLHCKANGWDPDERCRYGGKGGGGLVHPPMVQWQMHRSDIRAILESELR